MAETGSGEFTFFAKFGDAVARLPRELGDELIVALVRYGAYGEEPDLGYPLDALFLLMREDVCNSVSARERGSRGGRPPKARRGSADASPAEPGVSSGDERGVPENMEPGAHEGAEPGVPAGSEPVVSSHVQADVAMAAEPAVSDPPELGVRGIAEPAVSDDGGLEVSESVEPEVPESERRGVSRKRKQEVSNIQEPIVSKTAEPVVSENEKPEVLRTGKPEVSEKRKPKVSRKRKPNPNQSNPSQYRIDEMNQSSNPFGEEGESEGEEESFPPTLEAFCAWCGSRGFTGIDAPAVWERYEARGWTDAAGKPIRSWRALAAACDRNGRRAQPPAPRDAQGRERTYEEYD